MTERFVRRRAVLAAACAAGLTLALVPIGRSASAAKPETVGQIPCSSQPNVVADFNGDGVKDLVIGAPGDGLEKTEIDGSVTSSKPNAGSINITYGSKTEGGDSPPPAGLEPLNGPTGAPLFVSQDTPGVVDDAHTGDLFGSALTVGDFNGDGHPDLAVGAPGEDSQAGAVHIFYGGDATAPGIRVGTPGSSTYNQIVKIGSRLRGNVVGAGRHPGDLMGWSLANGDFNNDGFNDLAVGIPGYQIRTRPDAGAVLILYGSKNGLTAPLLSAGSSAGGRGLYQSGTGDAGAERGDFFGASLVAGDFNASTPADKPVADDLAVGAPGEDVGKAADAGAVTVFYGGQGGGVFFTENSPFMPTGSAATGDRFGCALGAGNFDNDTANDTDLAIGIPGKDIGPATDAGAVLTLYNSRGLTTSAPPEDCSLPVQPAAGTTGVVVHHSSSTSSSSSSNCWTDPQLWTENAGGIPGISKKGDEFGGALFGSDINSDGPADLIIGVPNESLYGDDGAGSIRVMFGFDKFGLTDHNAMAFAQRPSDPCTADDAENAGFCAAPPEYTEIGMTIEADDHFGQTLAVGDFDGDGSPDIVVGVPGESVGSVVNYALEEMVGYPSDNPLPLAVDDNAAAGALQVIYGKITQDATTHKNVVTVAGGTPDVLYRAQGGLRGALDGSGNAPTGQTNGQGVVDTLIDDGGGNSGAAGMGGLIGNPGLQAADGGPTTGGSIAEDHLAGALG